MTHNRKRPKNAEAYGELLQMRRREELFTRDIGRFQERHVEIRTKRKLSDPLEISVNASAVFEVDLTGLGPLHGGSFEALFEVFYTLLVRQPEFHSLRRSQKAFYMTCHH